MFNQTIQIFDRLIRRAIRRLSRTSPAPANTRPGLLRAEFECLESRSLLSLAPADDPIGSKLDLGWLQKPEYSDISILPIRPIEDGARPLPPNYPSMPSPPFEPYLPPPPSQSPDDSDVGGFTEIDNSDKGEPGILVGPVSEKTTREVQQMLDSLLYVPRLQNSDASPAAEPTRLRTQDEVSAIGAGQLAGIPEGGMIALVHDAAIVHSTTSDPTSHHDIDSWLSVPVRMDSAPGKFQAFEVFSAEPPPVPAPPLPINEISFLAPPNSPFEFASAAVPESVLQNIVPAESAAAIDQVLTESTVDLPWAPTVPPEQNNKNTSTRSAAAAAIFVFLAVRATRGARTTESGETHDQTTLMLRRPARPEQAT